MSVQTVRQSVRSHRDTAAETHRQHQVAQLPQRSTTVFCPLPRCFRSDPIHSDDSHGYGFRYLFILFYSKEFQIYNRAQCCQKSRRSQFMIKQVSSNHPGKCSWELQFYCVSFSRDGFTLEVNHLSFENGSQTLPCEAALTNPPSTPGSYRCGLEATPREASILV